MATAYYASKISPNQFETPTEGYRICRSVRICRTGYQDYLGSELKRHPSYDPAWNLEDDRTCKVFRPLDEVTSPATIASAEGKTIVDEHPLLTSLQALLSASRRSANSAADTLRTSALGTD